MALCFATRRRKIWNQKKGFYFEYFILKRNPVFSIGQFSDSSPQWLWSWDQNYTQQCISCCGVWGLERECPTGDISPYCLDTAPSKEWGGLGFKHKLLISLHLPQCVFVCTFASEIREQGCLITQGQLSNTLGALSSHIQYENYIYQPTESESLGLSATSGLCTKATEGKASWKAHLSFSDIFEVSYSFSDVFGLMPLLL